jgi:hypothetical protein
MEVETSQLTFKKNLKPVDLFNEFLDAFAMLAVWCLCIQHK